MQYNHVRDLCLTRFFNIVFRFNLNKKYFDGMYSCVKRHYDFSFRFYSKQKRDLKSIRHKKRFFP